MRFFPSRSAAETGAEQRHALERERRLELELEVERPARDLRHHLDALAPAASRSRSRTSRWPSGPSMPASSAVQLTGRPVRRWIAANSSRKKLRADRRLHDAVAGFAEAAGERARSRRARRRGSAPAGRRSRRGSATCEVAKPSAPARERFADDRRSCARSRRRSPRARSPPRPSRRGAPACGRRARRR